MNSNTNHRTKVFTPLPNEVVREGQGGGSSRGLRNNNPLNLRIGNNWVGERKVKRDAAFEEFETLEYGYRAAFIVLRKYINVYRRNTIEKIIESWAPRSENHTQLYIETVETITGIARNLPIRFEDKQTMIRLASAMTQVECGVTILPEIISSGYQMIKCKMENGKMRVECAR